MTEASGEGRRGAPWPALAAVVVVTTAGFAAVAPDLARTLVLGLPTILVPGWAVATAVAPRGWPDVLSRGAAVLGFGLVVTIACGLVLGASPVGLSAPAWLACLALVTAVALGVAVVRGARLGVPRPGSGWRFAVPIPPLVAGALLVLVAGVSVGIARSAAEGQRQAGFTQLWIQPVAAGTLELGVTSAEPATATYRLLVLAGTRPLGAWENVRLEPGETWSEKITVPAGLDGPVVARLYLAPGPEVYRSVTWWPAPGDGDVVTPS